jgi:hypothetical protein
VTPTAAEQEIPTVPGKERCCVYGCCCSHGCIIGELGALYPPSIIPGFDARRFRCTVKAVQQAFYDSAGNLVLPSELHKVFPVGAFVKVHFKIGAIKRREVRVQGQQAVNSVVRRTFIATSYGLLLTLHYRRSIHGQRRCNSCQWKMTMWHQAENEIAQRN